MRQSRRAEIVGAGFAGLAAACALAQRGWQVRVHERAEQLRTTGAGIYVYENGLRVLQALGAYEEAIAGALVAHTREVRDHRNRVVSVHRWGTTTRVFSIVRQQVINALVGAAIRSGAEIVRGSEGMAATPDGELYLGDGRHLQADLIIAADGTNSRLRDSLDLSAKRRCMPDGCIRILMENTPEERTSDGGTTIEYWSGSRRVLYTPCSPNDLYIALTMLDSDIAAKTTPIRQQSWTGSFPHLEKLFMRIGDRGRYDRFEYIKLRRWSSGQVAVIGDAAHALPPNIGQGAGCGMMNGLSLAVHLQRHNNIVAALTAWERNERPITDHTQRVSVLLGMPTTWPAPLRSLFFSVAGRSKWLIEQRTRTARHRPTGTSGDQVIA